MWGEVLTVGESSEHPSKEPFTFLAKELGVVVRCVLPPACFQLGIGNREKTLPVSVLQRDVYVTGGNENGSGVSDRGL